MHNSKFLLFNICLTVFSVANGLVYHGIATPPGGLHAWAVTIETTAVLHSSNFGSSWDTVEVPTIRDFFDVFFYSSDSGWTCGRAGDIWGTTDGGLTWTRQNLGGPKHAARIRFVDGEFGWAAGGDIVQLRTTNGGAEWQQVFLPVPPFPSGDTAEFQGVWFIDHDCGWLVAGHWPAGDTFQGGQGLIAKTTDGGENWQIVRRDTTYDFYDVYFADYNNGWVVGGNDRNFQAVVLYTSDGGNSWIQQQVPNDARFLRAVKFINRNYGWACGRNGTIIHTSDGGNTWVLQYSGADSTLFDIDFADTLKGMAAGNGVVVVTTDGGEHWSSTLIGVEDLSVQWKFNRIQSAFISNRTLFCFTPGILVDMAGQQLRELYPGENNLNGLGAGVYFVIPNGSVNTAGIMKVIIK